MNTEVWNDPNGQISEFLATKPNEGRSDYHVFPSATEIVAQMSICKPYVKTCAALDSAVAELAAEDVRAAVQAFPSLRIRASRALAKALRSCAPDVERDAVCGSIDAALGVVSDPLDGEGRMCAGWLIDALEGRGAPFLKALLQYMALHWVHAPGCGVFAFMCIARWINSEVSGGPEDDELVDWMTRIQVCLQRRPRELLNTAWVRVGNFAEQLRVRRQTFALRLKGLPATQLQTSRIKKPMVRKRPRLRLTDLCSPRVSSTRAIARYISCKPVNAAGTPLQSMDASTLAIIVGLYMARPLQTLQLLREHCLCTAVSQCMLSQGMEEIRVGFDVQKLPFSFNMARCILLRQLGSQNATAIHIIPIPAEILRSCTRVRCSENKPQDALSFGTAVNQYLQFWIKLMPNGQIGIPDAERLVEKLVAAVAYSAGTMQDVFVDHASWMPIAAVLGGVRSVLSDEHVGLTEVRAMFETLGGTSAPSMHEALIGALSDLPLHRFHLCSSLAPALSCLKRRNVRDQIDKPNETILGCICQEVITIAREAPSGSPGFDDLLWRVRQNLQARLGWLIIHATAIPQSPNLVMSWVSLCIDLDDTPRVQTRPRRTKVKKGDVVEMCLCGAARVCAGRRAVMGERISFSCMCKRPSWRPVAQPQLERWFTWEVFSASCGPQVDGLDESNSTDNGLTDEDYLVTWVRALIHAETADEEFETRVTQAALHGVVVGSVHSIRAQLTHEKLPTVALGISPRIVKLLSEISASSSRSDEALRVFNCVKKGLVAAADECDQGLWALKDAAVVVRRSIEEFLGALHGGCEQYARRIKRDDLVTELLSGECILSTLFPRRGDLEKFWVQSRRLARYAAHLSDQAYEEFCGPSGRYTNLTLLVRYFRAMISGPKTCNDGFRSRNGATQASPFLDPLPKDFLIRPARESHILGKFAALNGYDGQRM